MLPFLKRLQNIFGILSLSLFLFPCIGFAQKYNFRNYTPKNGLAQSRVNAFCEDKRGNIWMATNGGLSVFDGYDFKSYSTKDGLSSNTILTLCSDHRDYLWVGTPKGIHLFDGKKIRPFNGSDIKINSAINHIYSNKKREIWIATQEQGVFILKGSRLLRLKKRGKLIADAVSSIYQTNDSTMWLATSGGLLAVSSTDTTRYTLKEGLPSLNINALTQDTRGNLWLATQDSGIAMFDGKHFTSLQVKDGLCDNAVFDVAIDNLGNLWAATANGISCILASHDNAIISYHKKNGLCSNSFLALMLDSFGYMWFGSADGGVNQMANQSFVQYFDLEPKLKKSSAYNDSLLGSIKPYLKEKIPSSYDFQCIAINNKNIIFAGTKDKGIKIIRNDTVYSLNANKGLHSNNCNSLIIDNNKRLWVGSNQGVESILLNENFEVKSSRFYNNSNGFTGVECCKGASSIDGQGRLWFGTVGGAYCYISENDTINTMPPKISITGLHLGHDHIETTKYGVLSKMWSLLPRRLSLPYDKNNLHFSFSANNHSQPAALKYRWKLIGFDKGWSPLYQRRATTYTNLQPGAYTFAVTARNADGVWCDKPASYSFTINPPFWRTWWFVALVAVLVLAGIAFRTYTHKKDKRLEK